MNVAAIQMNSTEDPERNRSTAEALVREAASAGARLAVLPEKWNLLAEPERMAAAAEALDGPSTLWAAGLAAELRIDLVAGSITERGPDGERCFNTSVHLGPDGAAQGVYRKLHLFDVEVGGTVYRESDIEQPGEEIVVSELAGDARLGMSVCYDIRFPELFRIMALRGASVLAVPAAFTALTTRAHWEVSPTRSASTLRATNAVGAR